MQVRKTVYQVARAPSGAKLVDSRPLNAGGLQVVRSLVARAGYIARRPRRPPVDAAVACRTLEQDGCLMISNFLPKEEFDVIRTEAEQVIQDAVGSEHQRGATLVRLFQSQAVDDESFPALASLANDPRVLSIFSGAERRRLGPGDGLRTVEHVVFTDSGAHDAENELHLDTFFHTHKGWLYIRDVTEDNGPFVFVPGSHRLHPSRLWQDYKDSVGPREGSRRIGSAELRQRGLTERKFTCKANTLVIANTSGYHRRSEAVPGNERLAIHWSFRLNPFLPRSVDRRLRPLAAADV